jgi:hypothetical protein
MVGYLIGDVAVRPANRNSADLLPPVADPKPGFSTSCGGARDVGSIRYYHGGPEHPGSTASTALEVHRSNHICSQFVRDVSEPLVMSDDVERVQTTLIS